MWGKIGDSVGGVERPHHVNPHRIFVRTLLYSQNNTGVAYVEKILSD